MSWKGFLFGFILFLVLLICDLGNFQLLRKAHKGKRVVSFVASRYGKMEGVQPILLHNSKLKNYSQYYIMNKMEELECFRLLHSTFSDDFQIFFQKFKGKYQPLEAGDVLRKRYSENIEQSYRRTLTPKCGLNKTTKPLYSNHDSAQVFFCKYVTFFRTHSYKNTSE